jgi:hypothetical protein
MTRTAIRLAAIAALATACWTPAALAETKTALHDINMETFVDNCEDMGGTAIEGETVAGCDLPSGTQVVCTFQAGETGGLCEVDSRVASTSIKELLGGVLPNLVMGGSLTSNSDGGGSAPGGGGGGTVGGGGKGDHAAGAGGGPGVIAEDPLPPK